MVRRTPLAHALLFALLVVASCAAPEAASPTSPPPVFEASGTPKPVATTTASPELGDGAVATLTVSVYDSASGQPVAEARVVAFQINVAYVGTRLSDARCGISSEVYRVRGIEETYDTTKPPLIFRQRVLLGAR